MSFSEKKKTKTGLILESCSRWKLTIREDSFENLQDHWKTFKLFWNKKDCTNFRMVLKFSLSKLKKKKKRTRRIRKYVFQERVTQIILTPPHQINEGFIRAGNVIQPKYDVSNANKIHALAYLDSRTLNCSVFYYKWSLSNLDPQQI